MTDLINQDVLNRTDVNSLADALRRLGLGDLLRAQLYQQRRHVDMVAAATSAQDISTADVIDLPLTGKASVLLRATARVGTATAAELTVDAQKEAAPATLHVSVTPCGNIASLGSDAWTNLDVEYVAVRGDVVEITLPVSSNACTFPTSITTRGVIYLAKAESLVGTLTGQLRIMMPASSPSTGQAALTAASKLGVTFASADVVTRAKLTLIVAPAKDLNTVLDAAAQNL